MFKSIVISILICYPLILLQTSFFVHFLPFNLMILLIILINLFEKQEKIIGWAVAFLGGFLLDIFSNNFVGFYVLIFLVAAFFLKLILPNYIRIPKFSWI
jgi:rod shape-determining protein MreD